MTAAERAETRAAMLPRTREISGVALNTIDLADVIAAGRPVILKGGAADWPLVQAGLQSPGAAADLLKDYDSGNPVVAYLGDPSIKGRYHYNSELTALNFSTERGTLSAFLDRLLELRSHAQPPSLYIGSTDLDVHLPGLRGLLELVPGDDTFDLHAPVASIWIGNRTIAPAHWDMSNNLAVCVAGHRRFTLFPPDQTGNLYPGPIDPTPAGQIVSMVDPAAPDLARYPRFEQALRSGEIADLEPGDVLVYPALWWHQVEALDDFNVLINYWWNAAPEFLDDPMTTLLHALLSLRDRPMHEKDAWRHMFDHYVFGPAETAAAHLPAHARGPLAPLDPMLSRRLRALIANRINR